jgi:hypothetical protein
MKQMQRLFFTAGFAWMALWAIFGSLIGAKINLSLFSNDSDYLNGIQRELYRSAHAHMNLFSLVWMAMGLTLPWVYQKNLHRFLARFQFSQILGGILFGAGLLLESLFPVQKGQDSYVIGITALGGSLVTLGLCLWAVLLFKGKD